MKQKEQKTRVEMITLKNLKDLSLEFHYQNRIINAGNVKKIKDFIIEHGPKALGHMGTIIVSIKTRHQLDGQHRVQACLELLDSGVLAPNDEIPIQWIWCDTLEEEYEEIKRFNNTGKRWTSWDYFRGNKMVNDNYRRLEAFIKECPKLRGKNSTRPAYALLFGKSYNRTEFNAGKFTMTEEDRQRGLKMYKEIERITVYLKAPEKISTYGMAPKLNFEELACAWHIFRSTVGADINMDEFIDEFRTHEKMYNKMEKTNRTSLVKMFDRIHKNMIARRTGKRIRI
jgi:hypothetical protein